MTMTMLVLTLLACLAFPLLAFTLPSHSFHHRASDRPRIMTYYADWAPPTSFDCSLFDIIIFAFALPDRDFRLVWDSEQAPVLLGNLVSAAHAASSLAMLSIGGWSGSRYFSDAVASSQNRALFANNILDVYNDYHLDGIDIDWEFPGQAGAQGNTKSAADSDNMLQFFDVLHKTLPPGAMISAAVQDFPFAGPDGHPIKDASRFSHVLDWVTLMNYDVYENRQPPGPNSPLSDGCHNSAQPDVNAVSAYNAWTSAGFPPSKIVLGVPTYGYIVESSAKSLSDRSTFRAYSEDGTGQIQFRSLITQGILLQHPDGSFRGSGGFIRRWDNCSATPYLYSDEAAQVIPYDDNESLGIKAAWVKDLRMGGVNLFDAHGDTSEHHLTRALRAALLPNNTHSAVLSTPAPSNAPTSFPTASDTMPSSLSADSPSASQLTLALSSLSLPRSIRRNY